MLTSAIRRSDRYFGAEYGTCGYGAAWYCPGYG